MAKNPTAPKTPATEFNRDPKYFFEPKKESGGSKHAAVIITAAFAGGLAAAAVSYWAITKWTPRFIPAFIAGTSRDATPAPAVRLPGELVGDNALAAVYAIGVPKNAPGCAGAAARNADPAAPLAAGASTACPIASVEGRGIAIALDANGTVASFDGIKQDGAYAWDFAGNPYPLQFVRQDGTVTIYKVKRAGGVAPIAARLSALQPGERLFALSRQGFAARLPSMFNDRILSPFAISGRERAAKVGSVAGFETDITLTPDWLPGSPVIDEQGLFAGYVGRGGNETARTFVRAGEWNEALQLFAAKADR